MNGGSSPNRFDAEDIRDAVSVLREMRRKRLDEELDPGETDVSNLRGEATGEEKIKIYVHFRRRDISETVARILLGDALETIKQDRAAVHEVLSQDTSGLIQ